MTILQRIINAPIKLSAAHISEPEQNVSISEITTPPEEKDLAYETLNPSYQDIITNVPRKAWVISFLDVCLFVYGYILRIDQFFMDVRDGFFFMRDYLFSIKTAKQLTREFKRDKKKFIKDQVRAMSPAIARFNNKNYCSFWETGNTEDTSYRIRNIHTSIKNRTINRHWS